MQDRPTPPLAGLATVGVPLAFGYAERGGRQLPEDPDRVTRASSGTDNGHTWLGEQVIYVGANGEPFVYETPTGEVQVYFTHSAQKGFLENVVGSTGVAIIRSRDRGRTWMPHVTDYPYAADRVAQQYTRTTEAGVKMSRIRCPARSRPADRQVNVFCGATPYLARFRSGESILAYTARRAASSSSETGTPAKFGEPEVSSQEAGSGDRSSWPTPRQLATTMANVRSHGNKIMIGVLDLADVSDTNRP